MRNLTSINSATAVRAEASFHLKASDQSTTWIFNQKDIQVMPQISWEVAFGGGLGKPSTYNITLSTSMGFIAANLPKIVKAETFFNVTVNSDNMTPHVGRVRDISRDGNNPNILNLKIYDRFLDGNPVFPLNSIVESYSTVHPDVIDADMGYPVYYGKHTRPFYMTPIDCDIATLLGPQNVSSENHVTSLWFHTDQDAGFEKILLEKNWLQQSGSTNKASSSTFRVFDSDFNNYNGYEFGSPTANPGSYYYPSSMQGSVLHTTSLAEFDSWGNGIFKASDALTQHAGLGIYRRYTAPIVKARIRKVVSAVGATYDISITMATSKAGFPSIYTITGSANVTKNLLIAQVSSHTLVGSAAIADGAFMSGGMKSILNIGGPIASNLLIKKTAKIGFIYDLDSEAYKNYYVAGTQVNCTDIAVSENASSILRDILTRASIGVNSAQFLTASADVASYNFQCFFGERENVSDIIDDFGKITGSYLWVGDSGYINARTYQESATATNCINYTITTSDISNLQIMDNPLGTTTFDTAKARRVKVDFDYNFTSGKYEQSINADKSNNSFCDSADAAGITKEISFKSKYIKESDTASLWLSNAVRKAGLNETIVQMTLPARFLGMELADILHVHHPSLLNSASLFQVTRITPNYDAGNVSIKANELLNGTGF